jgi:hypothetical protein
MGDLTITAADVAAVEVIEQFTAPAHEAITPGQAVYFVAATGKVGLADENAGAPLDHPVGVAIIEANAANITITAVRKGLIDLGDALDSLDYDAIVYLSATAGKLADADPGNTKVVGRVVPGWGYTTADKLLRVDL